MTPEQQDLWEGFCLQHDLNHKDAKHFGLTAVAKEAFLFAWEHKPNVNNMPSWEELANGGRLPNGGN